MVDRIRVCKVCGAPQYTSYLLYRPEITTPQICYNAGSPLCKECEEPECENAGKEFKRKIVEIPSPEKKVN